jgi:hypothetical protein
LGYGDAEQVPHGGRRIPACEAVCGVVNPRYSVGYGCGLRLTAYYNLGAPIRADSFNVALYRATIIALGTVIPRNPARFVIAARLIYNNARGRGTVDTNKPDELAVQT